MRWLVLLLVLIGLSHVHGGNQHGADMEDNEFAEFEDFDEVVEPSEDGSPTDESADSVADFEMDEQVDEEDEDAIVETEEDEFDTLDPEEFEGLPGDDSIWENGDVRIRKKPKKSSPEIKIANVPIHMRSWDKYYLEILMSVGLAVYIVNFFLGKFKNGSIASSWLTNNLEYLSKQFELIGDDPSNKTAESTKQLIRESEHNYTLWCSGRQFCEGMLVEIKLLKRQDLISIISNQLKPGNDQIVFTVTLTDMDPYVFCCGSKKAVANLHKTMQDLNVYCTEKSKPGDKYGLSPNTVVLSELYGDLPSAILSDKVVKVLKDSGDMFESLHISDQFSGPLPVDQDEQTATKPETTKVIILTLTLPKGKKLLPCQDQMTSLLKMVVYMIDRIKKYRLSKEGKFKADKHRQEALTKYLKQTHAQRQEAAQQKKEEKERALKDKMMNEEDPEKQRRMDEMLHRREMNKKNKKMMKSRQYKVKSM